jgi:hypothetical protein
MVPTWPHPVLPVIKRKGNGVSGRLAEHVPIAIRISMRLTWIRSITGRPAVKVVMPINVGGKLILIIQKPNMHLKEPIISNHAGPVISGKEMMELWNRNLPVCPTIV